MARRKTHEEFVAEVKTRWGDEVKILGEYNGSEKNILIEHSCGHKHITQPRYLIKGWGACPICYSSVGISTKKTHKMFSKQVSDKFGDKYVLKGKYVRAKDKLLVLNNECGHSYEISPDNLLRGKGCPFCRKEIIRNAKTLSNDVVLEKILKVMGNKVELLEPLKRCQDKIKVRCKVKGCDHTWETTPTRLMNGNGCFKCGVKKRAIAQTKTHSQFLSDMFFQWGDDFEVLSDYINNKTKVSVRHKCGHVYMVQPSSLLSGFGCPICAKTNKSKGETKIREFLERARIDFIQEFRIQNDSRKYDFKIGKNIILEFDGEQHFSIRRGSWGKEISLKKQQEIDLYKTKLALLNGYKLIRISYTEIDNINNILRAILTSYSLDDISLFGKEYGGRTWN